MKVVIVGGGFGGIKTAILLAKDRGNKVTLISDRDQFIFYPTMYSTATGRSKQQSVLPIEDIIKDTSITFIKDTLVSIDTVRKIIVTHDHQITYDNAVFA